VPYMHLFRDTIGLSDPALEAFQRLTERRFAFRWTELDVPEMAGRAAVPPTLVVHDREDRETNWQDGADIAARWPGARLMTTTGLGHNRILRDPCVVGAVLSHLPGKQNGPPGGGPSSPTVPEA
jgi:pimeloyl-ACP methyl ester carboxylesterase